MHRSDRSATSRVAHGMPPLSAAGWLMASLNTPAKLRDERNAGDFAEGSQIIANAPPATAGQAARRGRPHSPVLNWLHHLVALRVRRA